MRRAFFSCVASSILLDLFRDVLEGHQFAPIKLLSSVELPLIQRDLVEVSSLFERLGKPKVVVLDNIVLTFLQLLLQTTRSSRSLFNWSFKVLNSN